MKAIYFIGILAFFLITVSNASAATYYLTEVNEPGDVPPGATIKVKVTCDGNTIIFQDESTGISDPAIKTIMFNLDPRISEISTIDWNNDQITESCANNFDQVIPPEGFPDDSSTPELKELFSNAGFGHFLSKCWENTDERTRKVDIILKSSCSELSLNDKKAHAVVHLQFRDANGEDGSIWVADDPEVPIPEFPSIVLPVAAIMGIILISQNRRKKN